jgi:hypothetical protein
MPAAFHKGAAGDDGNTAGWLQKCASVRLVWGAHKLARAKRELLRQYHYYHCY